MHGCSQRTQLDEARLPSRPEGSSHRPVSIAPGWHCCVRSAHQSVGGKG